MEIEQVAELARAVAGLPQAERDYFDGMVAKDAEENRIAKLRAMGDLQVLDLILKHARRGMMIFDLDVLAVAKGLVEAGFVRHGETPVQGEIPIVLTMSDQSTVMLRGKEEDLQRLCRDLRIGREIVSIFPKAEVA